jgi:3-dehydroquinate synthase
MLLHNVRRDSMLLALGGGVVGDVAGFVAATVLRGISYIQVPTTLLAQVDSSVGGKVGVDHPVGKNLIGAFHQPAAVYIDPHVLGTLPSGEFRNGLAEVVKIAAALDATFFRHLEKKRNRIARRHLETLTEIIALSVGLKAAVVQEDEFESGLRKTLNVGHSIGHAIEASTHFKVKHGAAVAMGMAAESRMAAEMGLLSRRDLHRVLGLMRALSLPTEVPRIKNKAGFLAALSADKKADARGVKFVLLTGIGRSAIGVQVPLTLITKTCRLT